MQKKSVEFNSEGSKVVANLYLPQSNIVDAPAILLCNGFAGVKELLLPAFAEYFASAGYIAMTFDYRGFGGSEGEPGRLVPALQIEDIKNAITFLSQRPEVDSSRIGLWGTSYGGANVVVAASEDVRVKAISVQLTFADGERVITSGMNEDERSKFFGTIEKMEKKKERTGKEMMVPIVKVLSDDQSKEFYKEYADEYSALKIKIPFLTIAETLKHKPVNAISNVNVPVLVVAATNDSVNPISESRSLFEAANEPKELFELEETTHYEVYSGSAFDEVATRQVSWFNNYM
ncbi:MAG: alpha/beta fold hydrolase [Candidatus Electrothrix sp. ATG2]|nr:alpha/beta fold hydrolase [Candidatus Electrothrix sp. ATG2]